MADIAVPRDDRHASVQTVKRGVGRQLLLNSARTLFEERGYAGTSTRAIARAASISEPMIFRYFGSKAGLFEEAVLAPFNSFMSAYMADRALHPRPEKSVLEDTRDFYRGVFDVLSANRRLIHEMIGMQARGDQTTCETTAEPHLGAILERFEAVIERERDDHGFYQFDPTVMSRLIFGLVFSAALHGDWMFQGATQPRPNNEMFINEMARLTVFGLYTPDPPPSADPSVCITMVDT